MRRLASLDLRLPVARIDRRAMLVAGAVVTKDLPRKATIVSNLTRTIGYNVAPNEALKMDYSCILAFQHF